MKSVALHNLGCKVNAYEIDVIQQMLQENGYSIVSFDEMADIYIINTCSVTNIADRKSRQMLHRAKKRNPDAIVVAMGCYVQTGQEILEADDCIDLIIGNNKKKDIISILDKFYKNPQNNQSVIDIGHTDEYEDLQLKQASGHTRAYIKIQDGCNQFCSYCIIPYARGRVRSRDMQSITEEVSGLAERGCLEIVLTGIHISSYGIDFDRKVNGDYAAGKGYLLELIRRLHSIEGISRIRLGSLEPRIITEEFASALSVMHKICPHFHLSLQSGCQQTLSRMNRRYTIEEYEEKVVLLRRYFDHPAVTTDIIVGFPGETEEEFFSTASFLDKIQFYEMHIFKYSLRQGTAAALMKEQVSEDIKNERSAILLEKEREQSLKFREFYAKVPLEVLFEEKKMINGTEYWVGHTKEYIKTAVKCSENITNRIKRCRGTGFLCDDILMAEMIQ